MSKVGIFGGSFDPVHIGHVEMAVQAKKELKLTEMLVIPAFDSPLKGRGAVPFAARFEMARLAFGEMDGFAVSDIEKKLGGKSYTINTLRALKEIYPPKTDFHLIIGGDALYTIEQWFRYEALLKECRVCAVTRGDMSYTDMQEYANELGRVKVLNTDIPDVSSTRVREMLATGEDVSGLVPEAVLQYIKAEGLYLG